MKLILQGSLELNGVSYQPGEEVDIDEELYDQLVESYLSARENISDQMEINIL